MSPHRISEKIEMTVKVIVSEGNFKSKNWYLKSHLVAVSQDLTGGAGIF
jgi:hypothetical protein